MERATGVSAQDLFDATIGAGADLALALAKAAQSGTRVAAGHLVTPASHAGAMAVQAGTLRLLGARVRGWKLAIGPQGAAVAAPLIAVVHLPGPVDGAITFHPASGSAIEVEVAFRLSHDLPPRRTPYDLAAITAVHLGVEVIGHRLDTGAASPFALFLADRLGNDGYLTGPPLAAPLARALLASADAPHWPPMQVAIAGRPVFDGPARHPNGHPLLPLLAYANAQTGRLGGLRAGQVITTGSFCGLLACAAQQVRLHWPVHDA
ncbi:MAG: hypothetical protein ACT4OK_16325 [Gemmobacter sp.]